MNKTSVTVLGILNPDGTLELKERPDLPAGRVEVTISALPKGSGSLNLWEQLQRTRAELEASGRGFRSKEEIDADIEDMRDWGGKIDEIYRQLDEERRRTGEAEGTSQAE